MSLPKKAEDKIDSLVTAIMKSGTTRRDAREKIDAAELYVAGVPNVEISQRLGLPKYRVPYWLREDDIFRSLVSFFMSSLLHEVEAELILASKEAVGTLRKVMKKSSSDRVKVDAAKDILDRTGFKPATKQQISVTQSNSFFDGKSREELVDFLDSVPGEIVDIG